MNGWALAESLGWLALAALAFGIAMTLELSERGRTIATLRSIAAAEPHRDCPGCKVLIQAASKALGRGQ